MPRWWLTLGPKANWQVAFANGNIWGLKDTGRPQLMWDTMKEDDRMLFYVTTPIAGVVGYGTVRQKFKQDHPLWPDEIQASVVLWPLRFEFDIDYVLPMENWEQDKISSAALRTLARGGFQPIDDDLAQEVVQQFPQTGSSVEKLPPTRSQHNQIIEELLEAGRLQKYIAEKEYRINNERLDVVWRSVENSVPTYVFEVQVGGDLYHALGKLKHAHDIWNSRIFLVANETEEPKVQALLDGTFREVQSTVQFISVDRFRRLLELKREIRDIEQTLRLL